jgi:type III secretory pathway component EscT
MTDHYLSLIFNHPNFNLTAILNFFLLGLARIVPIVAIPPFFGSKSIPGQVKMGLSVCICAIVLPQLILTAKVPLELDFLFMGLFIKELFIGFILAFLVTMPFYIAQSAGIIIDFMRGSSSLIGQDPTMSNQTSIIGILYNQISIVTFFWLNGPYLFINALILSFSLLPQEAWMSPIFFAKGYPFWQQIISLAHYVLVTSIQLGAPAIVGCLAAEVFLGIANRLAPQVQIAFLGMSIKSLLGIALLCVGWVLIIRQINKEMLSFLDTLHRYIYLWKSS